MLPKLIYVGGVQGVGKSTSIEQAVQRLNEKYPRKVEQIRIGHEMGLVSQKRFGKKPEDITPKQLQSIMVAVVRKIRKSKAKVVVLDHHFTTSNRQATDDEHKDITLMYPSNARFMPLVKELVLLDAPLSQVREQRVKQAAGRPLNELSIQRQLVSQKLVARLLSREHGKPLTVIDNEPDNQSATILKLIEVIESHLG